MDKFAGVLERRRWVVLAAWIVVLLAALPFAARQTDHLTSGGFEVPGSQSQVVSDNIHRFEAGRSGARGVDITTLHGADVGFSFIEMGDKPADAGQRIYEAAWKNPGP